VITVESTGDVPLETLRELFREPPFDALVAIDERQHFFKSVDTPMWVRVLMSAETWQVLLAAGVSGAAAGYGGAAGKAAWKRTAKAGEAGSKLLLKLATKLTKLKAESPSKLEIAAGVPISSNYSAFLRLAGVSADEIEAQLVALAIHSEGLGRFLTRTDVKPVGWVSLSLDEDAQLVASWMDGETLSIREQTFPLA